VCRSLGLPSKRQMKLNDPYIIRRTLFMYEASGFLDSELRFGKLRQPLTGPP